tara:strand:+ start:151 stop:306 length:156 start_codon:yes stop_codon:yes gene_type:complete
VDSFPSLESWTAAKLAIKGNAEGEAIEKEFNEAADYSVNRFYYAEQSYKRQ